MLYICQPAIIVNPGTFQGSGSFTDLWQIVCDNLHTLKKNTNEIYCMLPAAFYDHRIFCL